MKYLISFLLFITIILLEDKFGLMTTFNRDNKKEVLNNEFALGFFAEDNYNNNWDFSVSIKESGDKDNIAKYNEVKENIEQNISKLYIKQGYNYDSQKNRYNINLSTGKSFNFSKQSLRFDTGCIYTKYPDVSDWKMVFNSNYLYKEFALRYHQRFNNKYYDWWFEVSQEVALIKQLMVLKVLYQLDYENFYNYTETEIKIELYINLLGGGK